MGTERRGLNSLGSMGYGVQAAQGEVESSGVRYVDLLRFGEVVDEGEEILGIEGGGGIVGEDGVGLVIEGEEELGSFGHEIEQGLHIARGGR